MTHKLGSTRCTLRQTTYSNTQSQASSRIIQGQTDSSLKGLSFSLQNIKNPFPQSLPLKFPKNRIIKGFNTHMLTQTQQTKFRPGLRQSYLQNQQFQQKPYVKQKAKGQFYTFNQQSNDNTISNSSKNNVKNLLIHKSLQKLHYSSLQKQSKKIFHHIIVSQTIKNPISHGEQKREMINHSFKKTFQDNQKQKNFSKNCKEAFEWNTSLSKQKFNNKCNAKPKDMQLVLTLNLKNNQQKKSVTNTERKISRNQAPKTSRETDRQQTYMSIYNSKRKYLGF